MVLTQFAAVTNGCGGGHAVVGGSGRCPGCVTTADLAFGAFAICCNGAAACFLCNADADLHHAMLVSTRVVATCGGHNGQVVWPDSMLIGGS